MRRWKSHLGDRGKAMIALVAVPLLLPAAVGSFHAIRLWVNTDQLNPSMEGYHRLMEDTSASLTALEKQMVAESSAADWEAVIETTRRRLVEVAEQEQQARADAARSRPRPKTVMLGDLALQGIFWKAGRPLVYVNGEVHELNEEIEGWKITYIGKSTMVVADPKGNEKIYDLDAILQQLYPGYVRP